MEDKNERYERFKADILQWKNEHREQYAQFARAMTNGDENHYLAICSAIFKQLPRIQREWELLWDDDSIDSFESIDLQFKESAVPEQIAELFHKQREKENSLPSVNTENSTPPSSTLSSWLKSFFKSKTSAPCIILCAPLVLSWLYYGRSFEAMVDMIKRQSQHPKADKSDKRRCAFAIKHIISVSVAKGFRTQADWESNLSMSNAIDKSSIVEWALSSVADEAKPDAPDTEKEDGKEADLYTKQICERVQMLEELAAFEPKPRGRQKVTELPLADCLNCEDKDAVIEVVRRFITNKDIATEQALCYYALRELDLLTGIETAKEFAIALTRQFEGLRGLKSESSYRQAIHKLTTRQYMLEDGQSRLQMMLESDTYKAMLSELKHELKEAIARTYLHESDETG